MARVFFAILAERDPMGQPGARLVVVELFTAPLGVAFNGLAFGSPLNWLVVENVFAFLH